MRGGSVRESFRFVDLVDVEEALSLRTRRRETVLSFDQAGAGIQTDGEGRK